MPDKHKPLTEGALDEMLRYYHYDSLEYRAASELRELRTAAEPLAKLGQQCRQWAWEDHEVSTLTSPGGAEWGTVSYGALRALAKACGKGDED